MPNRTIYIRVEDLDLFNKLYSAEWLHKKLNEEQEASDED